MVPKKIHYCWFGGASLPKSVEKCIESWKKYCPEYEIICWNESNFDITQHPFVKAAYEAKKWAFVSDYARLKIILDNGGIYLDTDVEILRNIDEVLDNTCYFAEEQLSRLVNTGLGFGAEKDNPVVRAMLDVYETIVFDAESIKCIVCPLLNTKVLEVYGFQYSEEIQYLDGVTIYPPKYFDPISPGTTKNFLCEVTYSIHHYDASWTSSKYQMRRKILRWIGEENVIRIKKFLKRGKNDK